MIKGEKICKAYDTKEVLKELTINIQKGSIYGLVGVNGCGKSTLLKVLKGIFKGDKGAAKLEGEDVYSNMEAKSRIFYMSEESYAFHGYTVKKLAEYYAGFYRSFSWDRFKELNEIFEFDMKASFASLSKGQKKQAMFWIGLSLGAEVMILDEPLDGLDPIIRRKVKRFLIEEVAQNELTILISSHNLLELEGLCDHIGIMNDGKIMVENNLDDLKSSLSKVQYVLGDEKNEMEYLKQKLVNREKRGKVTIDTIQGEQEEIVELFQKRNALFFDLMPMTLEEVFVAELEGKEYEYEKIIIG